MDDLSILIVVGVVVAVLAVLWFVILKPIRDGTVDKDDPDEL